MFGYQQHKLNSASVTTQNKTVPFTTDNRPVAVQQRQIIQKQANKTGLPDNLKSGIENLSGYSMDDVRVHYNSSKPAQMSAHAYAQGTNIHVASGQEKHLPHEAWHVVQQKQGRVQPTTTVNGAPVNDSVHLEKEADVMGAKALQMKPKENKSRAVANSVVQKKSNVRQGFDFVDNRPEAFVQRQLRDMANNRPQTLSLQLKESGTSKSFIASDNKVVQLKEIEIDGNNIETDHLIEEALSDLLDRKDLSSEVKADLITALYKKKGITFPMLIPNPYDHQNKDFVKEFKSGDLIYGRSEKRADFYGLIPDGEKYEDNIIDAANNRIGFADPKNYKSENDFNKNLDVQRESLKIEISNKNDELKSKKEIIKKADEFAEQGKPEKATTLLSSQEVFTLKGELKNLEFTLLHLEKSSGYISEVFKWSNEKLFKGLESQDLNNPSQALIVQARTYRGCVRACKNCLTIAPNSAFKQIHFTLDGMDSSQVTNKEVKVPLSFFDNKIKGEPVTSKELRAVYRFLSDNDSMMALKVIPYRSKIGVSWPWEDPSTKVFWSKYIAQRKLKKELD